MKKSIVLLTAVLLLAAFLAGCSDDNDEIIEVSDRFFINQVMSIIINSDQYLGRTIQYEGVFWIAEHEGLEYHFALRFIFDCCGNDGFIGFELNLDGIEPLPHDAWVEVVGVLETSVGNALNPVRLRVISLTELEERGNEFVQ